MDTDETRIWDNCYILRQMCNDGFGLGDSRPKQPDADSTKNNISNDSTCVTSAHFSDYHQKTKKKRIPHQSMPSPA